MRIHAKLLALVSIPALAGLFVLGGTAAASASAGPEQVTAVTHAMHHADTTSVSGPCTVSSPGGPVWAYDNLSFRLVAVPTGPGEYSVTIYANGSFDEFSDPETGACATGHGSVDGWLNYDVTSSTPPDPANVPSQEPGTMSQGAILNQFFDGNAHIVGGGSYHYVYNRIDGGKYIQNG